MSEVDNGMKFSVEIDTSNVDKGKKKVVDDFNEIGEAASKNSKKIDDLIKDVPKMSIDVTDAIRSIDTVDAALKESQNVLSQNITAIVALEAEEKRLGAAYSETFQKSQQEADAYAQQREVIRQNIALRKEIVQETMSIERTLESAKAKFDSNSQKIDENSQKSETLRQQIRNLKEEMASLIASGIDETSDAYKRLATELGRLEDIQSDVQQQGRILANDQATFQGIISGVSGLSGAMSAATGTMALFGEENEDLQRVMTRLQSVMAITMGLQQLQQTLNKDSAFQLVTLNGLKQYWNRLLAVGRGEQAAETAATVTDTTAKTANAAAQTAVNASATAGTTANIGLAGSFRMIGAAIKSIPVFGWIVAGISALIAVYEYFSSKAKEATKALEEQQKMLEESRQTYAKASMQVSDYIDKIDRFNGTKKQEKKMIEELNSKYGEALGYYDSLAKWKDVLKRKGEVYCEMLLMEARAQALLNKYTEAFVRLQEVKAQAENGEFDHWYNTAAGDKESREKAIAEAQADVDKWEKEYKELMQKIQNVKDANDLNYHSDPKATKASEKAAREAIEAKRRLFEIEQKQYIEQKRASEDLQYATTEAKIKAMQEGSAKELAQIQLKKDKEITAIERAYEDMRLKRIEAAKQVWEADTKNKGKNFYESSDFDLANVNTEAEEQNKNAKINAVNAEYERETKDRLDRIIAAHQSYIDRKTALEKKYHDDVKTINEGIVEAEKLGDTERVEALRRSLAEAAKSYAEDQAKMSLDQLKDMPEYVEAFEDLDKVTNETLNDLISMFQKVKDEQAKSLAPTEMKEYMNIIEQMQDKLRGRDPFGSLVKSAKALSQSKKDLKKATSDYTKVANGEKVLVWEINKETLKMEAHELTLEEAKKKKNTAQKKYNKTQKEYDEVLEKNIDNVNELAGEIDNLGGVIGGMAGSILGLASQITTVVTSSITGINKLSSTAAASISAVEKASVIIGIISTALQVLTAIFDLFGESEEEKKQREKRIEMMNTLTASVINYRMEVMKAKLAEQEWFSSTNLQGLADQWMSSQKALIEYEDYLDKFWEKYRQSIGVTGNTGYSIDDTKAQVNAWFRENQGREKELFIFNENSRAEALVDFAKRIYKDDLFGEDGVLNVELAKKILEDYGDQLIGSAEEILKELSALAEEYKKWQESLKSYISDLYSPLADDLTDALWDFAENGTDAMKSFENSARSSIQAVGKEMIKSLINVMLFEELKAKLQGIYTEYAKMMAAANNTDNEEERRRQIEAALDFLRNGVGDALTGFKNTTEAALPTLQEISKEIYNTIDGIFPSSEVLEIHVDAIKSAFQNLLDDPTQNIEEWGKNFRNSLIKQLVLNKVLGQEFEDWAKQWGEKFNNVWKDYNKGNLSKSAFDEIMAGFYSEFDGMSKELSEKAKALMESLGFDFGNVATESEDNPFKGLRDMFVDTLTDMEDDAESFKKRLEEIMVKDLIEKQIFDVPITVNGMTFDNFTAYVEDWNKRYADAVKSGNQEAIDALIDELVRVRQMTLEQAEGLRDRLKEVVTEEGFRDLRATFMDALTDMKNDAANFGKNIALTMIQQMMDEFVKTKYQDQLNDISRRWGEALKAGDTDAMEKLRQEIIELYNAIENDEAIKKFLDNMTNLTSEIQTPFDNMRDSFRSALMDMTKSAQDFTKEINQMIAKDFIDDFVMGSAFDEKLAEWKKRYREITTDGNLTEEQRLTQLRQLAGLISSERDSLTEQTRNILNMLGLGKQNEDQRATMNNMAEAATYDQFETYLGIAMGQQLALEQGNDVRREILQQLRNMGGGSLSTSDGSINYVSEIRNMITTTNEYLLAIKVASEAIRRDFEPILNGIRDNTSRLQML